MLSDDAGPIGAFFCSSPFFSCSVSLQVISCEDVRASCGLKVSVRITFTLRAIDHLLTSQSVPAFSRFLSLGETLADKSFQSGRSCLL
jgi:hypothetical protein